MYHVDRNIDLPPKLQSWTIEVAQPHMNHIDPSFLRLDTQSTTWAQLLAPSCIKYGHRIGRSPMDCSWYIKHSFVRQTLLQKAARLPHPPPPHSCQAPTYPATKLSSLSTASKTTHKRPSKKSATTTVLLPNLNDPPPPLSTNLDPPPPPDVWKNKSPPKATKSTAPTSNPTVPISSVPPVATNDGTYRLTFRWKPKTNYSNLAENQSDWLIELLRVFKLLFSDRDGELYRWESSDLSHKSPISKLTPVQLRDYISPRIASLDSHSTFVFGIRFSFSQKPPFQ